MYEEVNIAGVVHRKFFVEPETLSHFLQLCTLELDYICHFFFWVVVMLRDIDMDFHVCFVKFN